MSSYTSETNDYPSAASLIGNVDVPRHIQPLVRSWNRRLNADGVSSAPYYASVAGKTLRIVYTEEIATVVTPANMEVTFTGSTLAQIITDINAVDAPNIEALDLGGFLGIRNKNLGKTHYVIIDPYGTPASDAAPYIGFPVFPAPGSASYAGELATAPGNRSQANPSITTLIAQDEDFTAGSFNRALTSVLMFAEQLRLRQNITTIAYQDVELTFANHPVTAAKRVARINESKRLYIPTGDLESFFQVLTTSLAQAIKSDYTVPKITQIYYATAATALVTTPFATWGTPDGGSVIDATVPDLDKHASTAITSISNNIVYCAGATFTTKLVTAGDFVYLTASNLQPFDHTGWYVVDQVIDQTHLVIRSCSDTESPPTVAQRPRFLNKVAGGTLRVAVGSYIWANDLWLEVDDTATTTVVIRMPVGQPNYTNNENNFNFSGSLGTLSSLLGAHVNDTDGAHAATAISGFTSAQTWKDTTAPTGATLRDVIEDVIADLGSSSAAGGSLKVGAEAVSIGGATPNTIAAGSVNSQLISLLTTVRDHIVAAAGAHEASAISYLGGDTWADASTNPAATVEAQLDKILTDLAGAGVDGAVKIRALISAGTHTLPDGTIRSQLDYIRDNYFRVTGLNGIGQTNTWTADQISNNMKWDVGAGNAVLKPIFNTPITVAANQHQLIWDFGPIVGTQPHLRLYLDSNDQFEIVWNAEWSTVGTDFWFCDDSAQQAVRVVIGPEFHIQYKEATASLFADSFFTTTGDQVKVDLVNSLVTLLGGLVVDGDLEVSGQLYYGLVTVTYGGLGIRLNAGGGAITYVGDNASASPLVGSIALDKLPLGARILAVRCNIRDHATGPCRVTARLRKQTADGTLSNVSALETSAGTAGTAQVLTLDSLPVTHSVAGETFFVAISVLAGSEQTFLYGIEVDYDLPAA